MSDNRLVKITILGTTLFCGALVIMMTKPLPMKHGRMVVPRPIPAETPAAPVKTIPDSMKTAVTQKSSFPKPADAGQASFDVESVADYNAVSAYGPLPDYLSDVGFDGGFEVDDQGKLIIDQDVRRLFDFFLAAVRVEGTAVCSGRINEYIGMTLPPDAAANARSVWGSYQTYRERMKDLYREFSEKRTTDPEDYKTLVRAVTLERYAIRRQCMTEDVVRAFFAEEEIQEAQALSMMEAPFPNPGTGMDDRDS